MKRPQQAFTLVELMTVIAIIGILVGVALPVYQTYTRKAAYAELTLIMSTVKAAVSACFNVTNSLTACDTADEIGIILPANQTEGTLNTLALTENTAVISAIPNEVRGLASNQTCTLTPQLQNGLLTWSYNAADPCVTHSYVKL